ncbi:MAG: hypothetical protein JXA54_13650 [Candidatus Heimdallarchaeota archaeon]|nr:hypothetical protein [Candidatus Heimdallarchaeota archaeon]
MTYEDLEVTRTAEKFYNALRGFIVIEESGLPKYIEFLTEEQIDVILLAGLLSGLQTLAEVISDERIKTIETSNSIFSFVLRSNYFYVTWFEKTISEPELYEPIIMKLISRFEGATTSDKENALLISNLTETPDYEKFGRRVAKLKSVDIKYSEIYKKILSESMDNEKIKRIGEELCGIDGVLIINDKDDAIEHSEFPRGEPIFEINILTNFLVGLRKSLKNIDPGNLEEITTENYRFIIYDKLDYFYVFEVIKGLAQEEQLLLTMRKIISRYEGVRKKNYESIELLKDLKSISEHELLGQLSLELRDRQSESKKIEIGLSRQASKISFGDEASKWLLEEEQMHSFMDIYKEVFMVGIITPINRYFVMKKALDTNDWIESATNLELEKLLTLTEINKISPVTKLAQLDRQFWLTRITDKSVLFVILDSGDSAIERFMLRLPLILRKISKNII